jgi:XFP-like protein
VYNGGYQWRVRSGTLLNVAVFPYESDAHRGQPRTRNNTSTIRIGAVLPLLHLNGYKIAGTTVLARTPHDELEALFRG